MTTVVPRRYALLALGLIACSGKAALRVQRLAADHTVVAAVGDDLLVLDPPDAKQPPPPDEAIHVARLKADGTYAWHAAASGTWLIDPTSDVAYVVKRTQGQTGSLATVSMRDGATTNQVDITAAAGSWRRSGEALYLGGVGSLARVDPKTGKTRWETSLDSTPEFATPGSVWASCNKYEADGTPTLCGFGCADGAPLPPVVGYQPTLSPDGKMAVVLSKGPMKVIDVATSKVAWSVAPRTGWRFASSAASNEWVALVARVVDHDDGAELAVYKRADGTKVWSLAASAGAFGYVAVGKDLVGYFDSRDHALHVVHIPDGAEAIVHRFGVGLVVGTERAGVDPAVPDGPPKIDGNVVLVEELGKKFAYRVSAP